MNEQMTSALELNIKRALALNYTYNARGQRKTVSYTGFEFGTGEPYQDRVFTYDDSTGNLIRDNKEDGQYITYAYDEAGNLIETSYSGGHVVYYTHDALNRLETVTDEKGIAKYTYDKVGNRKSMTYPNETVATYEYDNLNRLIYLENKGPDGVISSYRYTLGPAGNRLKIEENNGDICDYSYDKLYRLTRESRTGEHAYWISYEYDAFGNRLEMNANGAMTEYDYDDNDRLLEESGPTGVIEYDYDKNGNTLSKEGPDGNWIYEWNVDNKLISAKLNDQPSAGYQYDLDGERVTKTTPEGTTRFLIDINNQTGYSQALRETDASNTELVAFTFGDDLISQEREDSSFYHYDGLGSTRVLTSLASVVTDTYSYLSFGSILARTGVTQNTFLFTGDMYDFNIGFYYLRARLYNPSNGRFLSVDPFQGVLLDPISLHKYLYAKNSPVNYTDPTGMFTFTELMTVVSIITIVVSLALYFRTSVICLSYRHKWKNAIDKCAFEWKYGPLDAWRNYRPLDAAEATVAFYEKYPPPSGCIWVGCVIQQCYAVKMGGNEEYSRFLNACWKMAFEAPKFSSYIARRFYKYTK